MNSYNLGQDNYVCKICGRGLLTKVGMKMHALSHVDPKLTQEDMYNSYICDICIEYI